MLALAPTFRPPFFFLLDAAGTKKNHLETCRRLPQLLFQFTQWVVVLNCRFTLT